MTITGSICYMYSNDIKSDNKINVENMDGKSIAVCFEKQFTKSVDTTAC